MASELEADYLASASPARPPLFVNVREPTKLLSGDESVGAWLPPPQVTTLPSLFLSFSVRRAESPQAGGVVSFL